MKLESLPDYPALQQIGRALWKTGKVRGAAVLVGSGFSRNADLVDNDAPPPPLWRDLVAAMEARIYPGPGTSARRDPLRLAEEFKALLGEPALESLIRELVRDDEWLPGELHKRLVHLPWTDILTTNWDTLLERAALSNLGQTYETVRNIGDIATTRVPRIVKLHGSLPSNRPFIVSEEDYRTYPRRFAPFVNLVQQVLLENELCLIGFSGDDPNFLEWAGWIRDQLGASARRVFLVSALGFGSAERRLLESRHISPIDLSPLLAGGDEIDRQRHAAEIFIEYLVSSRPAPPWEWPLVKRSAIPSLPHHTSPVQLAESLRVAATTWEAQRISYPGWVICPPQIRKSLESDTIHALSGFKSALPELMEVDRGHIAFEILWRLDKALIPILSWIRESLEQLTLDDQCWRDQEERYFVALALLRDARENRNKAAFDNWQSFLETKARSSREIQAGVTYERCLWARDGLDFAELRKLIAAVDGPDPLWKLRRAALHCDLGDGKAARLVVSEAIRGIRERFCLARNSISVLSRLAWAQFLSHGIRSWNSVGAEEPADESEALRLRFFETKADPWDSIRAVEDETEENLRRLGERRRTTETLFDAGKYRDHSGTLHFGSWPGAPIYQLERIGAVAGVPARSDQSLILGPRMQRAEELTEYAYEDEADYLRLLRVVQAGKDDFLERTFGRIQVARLGEDRVAFLRKTLNGALDYSLEQLKWREGFADTLWSRRAATYTELLSRLAVRLGAEQAQDLFLRGLSYARDHRWKTPELFAPLAHLLERAFSAIPPRLRARFITEVIQFPLPEEERIVGPFDRDWPESAEWLPESLMSRPSPDFAFAERVAVLIDKTRRSEAATRARTVLRLAHLFSAGALTSEEATSFGEALWARKDSEGELPADTNLYSHMFLLLPSPDKVSARALVMARDREPSSAKYLIALGSAAQRRRDGTRALILAPEEALGLLKGILAWRPKEERPYDLGDARRENDMSKSAIGAVLADAIFPALNRESLSDGVIDSCFKLLEGSSVPSTAQALPELLRIDASLQDRVVKDLLRSLVSVDNSSAWAAFNALYRWTTMSKEGSIFPVPRRLAESVVSIIEARREPGLLHALGVSCQLVDAGLFTTDDIERLIAALGLVFFETSYSDPTCTEFRPTTFTLVRANAVRLADALQRSGRSDPGILECLKIAEQDPVPEVRFASSTSDE